MAFTSKKDFALLMEIFIKSACRFFTILKRLVLINKLLNKNKKPNPNKIKIALNIKGKSYVSFGNSFIENGEASVTTPELYVKVESISGSKERLQAIVYFYNNENKQKMFEKPYSFEPKLVNKNFIAQAYEHLKTLPEFAESEDC